MKFRYIIFFVFTFFPSFFLSQNIEWSKNRKLTYDDFKGKIQNEPGKKIDHQTIINRAAVSMIGWNYEASSSTSSNKIDIKLIAFFDPKKSWMKPEYQREDVLNHEQKHFDIAEAFKIKLQKLIDKEIKTKKDFDQKFQNLYKKIYSEYYDFQKKYDSETQHGILTEKQVVYDKIIDDMLTK